MARPTADTANPTASILELTQRLAASEAKTQALSERLDAAEAKTRTLAQLTTAISENQELQRNMAAVQARLNNTSSIIAKERVAKRKLKRIELALGTEEDKGNIAALKAKRERVLSKFDERMNIEHGWPLPVKGDERLRDCTPSESDDEDAAP